jgi:hypothetical protein
MGFVHTLSFLHTFFQCAGRSFLICPTLGDMTKQRSQSDDHINASLTESITLELELLSEIDYRHDPKPEQREGVEALNSLIANFGLDDFSPDAATIALLLMRLRDLQVRDFALGCMERKDLEKHVEMWRWVVRIAPIRFLAPPATLLSAISYEVGDVALATSSLEQALEADSAYPLALLLKRVFSAGWPAETFATMRTELHPKITAAIFEE